jgi:hypothetical protein
MRRFFLRHWARWRRQFEHGEGLLFYAVAALAALAGFMILWTMLAVGTIAGM